MEIKRAVFAGSFDPITNGHLSVITHALKVFDEVIVLLAVNPKRTYAYSLKKRLLMAKLATKNMKGVKVDSTDGLTLVYAKAHHALALIRGVRCVGDVDYEIKLANANQKINKDIPTLFFLADKKYQNVSATKVRAEKKKGANLASLVPINIIKYL